jgi:hypothetical protein
VSINIGGTSHSGDNAPAVSGFLKVFKEAEGFDLILQSILTKQTLDIDLVGKLT